MSSSMSICGILPSSPSWTRRFLCHGNAPLLCISSSRSSSSSSSSKSSSSLGLGSLRKRVFIVLATPNKVSGEGEDEEETERAILVSGRRNAQRTTYLFAAMASSVGITTLAAAAVYYRFVWQMQGSGEVPALEMLGTFSLAFGAAVGMEFWARWAHKALWHASLWSMHESHHRTREGPFELNDVFAIINAVPAISLMAYGFFHKGLVPGLCFGAGLGITVFGIAYMFVHDGLVHRRFPVGPIADVPYFQKVAAAHQLHHADLFEGVPYGLFLGPKELEQVGGSEELERLLKARRKSLKSKV